MDDRHSSTRLQAECQRLETEIKRLKELLEKHKIAFEVPPPARSSTVLPNPDAIAAVQGPESKVQVDSDVGANVRTPAQGLSSHRL
jgi:hypothetical protein